VVNNIAPYQIDTNSVGVQIRADLAPSTITLTLHRGRVNYLFADEHPKAFAFDDPEVSGSGTLTSPYGAGTVYLNDLLPAWGPRRINAADGRSPPRPAAKCNVISARARASRAAPTPISWMMTFRSDLSSSTSRRISSP
jgi:prepilin-type processing-associated H-X9-DG protein